MFFRLFQTSDDNPNASAHSSRLAAGLGLMMLVGCQSYHPHALAPGQHAVDWNGRSVDQETVREFARSLSQSRASATAFDPSDGLTIDEAEVVALLYNPDLRVARLRAGVARAKADFAGRWDDPKLGLDVMKITESVPDPWIVSGSLALTVPISGRLVVEKARAEAAHRVELLRVAETEWKVGRDLREAWATWSAGHGRLMQTRKVVDVLGRINASMSKLVEAGEVPRTESALFSIEQTSRRADLARFEGELAEREQRLRALMGLAPGATIALVPSLGIRDCDLSGVQLFESNLSLVRLATEYEVSERVLLREIRKQFPDVVIGPQGGTEVGQSVIGFLGTIPVPVLNSNKGGIAAARSSRELARAAYETEWERLSGRLAGLRVRQRTIRKQQEVIRTELVPMVDRQLADAGGLVELGESNGLVLLQSVLRAYEAKLKLIDLQLEEAQTNNEIRFLTGQGQGSFKFPQIKK